MSAEFYNCYILPHQGIILKICRAYTDTQEDFEDYFQEVCLQIWKSHLSFQGNSDLSTWIYRLSLNVCMTLFRKDKREKTSKTSLDVHSELPFAPELETQNEELALLYRGIRQLKEVDKAIILLYLEEKSYQEIADVIGVKANAVGVRINRIKEKLKKYLNEKIY